jgi:uncharacterized membrane protein YfcA
MAIALLERPSIKGLSVGLIAGFGGGLMSLGGGTLVIPLLMGWLKLTPLQARGTAIMVAIFSALTGAIVYGLRGSLDLQAALWVAIPSFIITPLAALWSEKIPAQALKRSFGLVVIMGGALVMFRDSLPFSLSVPAHWSQPYLIAVGIIEGLVAGVIGISGGPILAPLFVLGLGMPQQLAQGCSLVARLPATISGGWENWRLGNVCKPLVVPLAIGALAGAIGGSHLALALHEEHLRSLFGGLLLLLGSYYLLAPHH